MKYIVQCWEKGLREERTNNFPEARKIKRKMKEEKPDSYCCIIKVPFKKRHPNFPIYFSIVSLFLVGLAPKVDSCIRHILQIVQQWK